MQHDQESDGNPHGAVGEGHSENRRMLGSLSRKHYQGFSEIGDLMEASEVT